MRRGAPPPQGPPRGGRARPNGRAPSGGARARYASRPSPAVIHLRPAGGVFVMFSLLGVAVGAAYHVVSAYVQVLAPVTGSLATVAAIIAFTMTARLLLLPLSLSAARGQASQARLLPQVTDLRKRHAGHPDRLRIELSALYQRENASALAGCLPALLQLPFFSVMYRLFLDRTVNGRPNGLLSHSLLGAPLGSHLLSGTGPLSAQGAVFLGLLGLIAVVAWISARAARRAAIPGAGTQPGKAAQPGKSAQPGKPAQPGKSAPSAAVPGWLTRVLPYITVVIAAFVPLAAGIYLLTTTAWTTAERTLLRRRILPAGRPGPVRAGMSKTRPGCGGQGPHRVEPRAAYQIPPAKVVVGPGVREAEFLGASPAPRRLVPPQIGEDDDADPHLWDSTRAIARKAHGTAHALYAADPVRHDEDSNLAGALALSAAARPAHAQCKRRAQGGRHAPAAHSACRQHRPGDRRADRGRGAPAVREDPADPVGELHVARGP